MKISDQEKNWIKWNNTFTAKKSEIIKTGDSGDAFIIAAAAVVFILVQCFVIM